MLFFRWIFYRITWHFGTNNLPDRFSLIDRSVDFNGVNTHLLEKYYTDWVNSQWFGTGLCQIKRKWGGLVQKKLTIQAVSLPPDHLDLAKTHTIIGRILSQLQKFTEALANYECALKIWFQTLLWANLAKDQASIKSRNSSLADIYALIGDGHWEKGNFSEALQNYQLALHV